MTNVCLSFITDTQTALAVLHISHCCQGAKFHSYIRGMCTHYVQVDHQTHSKLPHGVLGDQSEIRCVCGCVYVCASVGV